LTKSVRQLRDMGDPPAKVTLQFGLKVSGELGLIIGKTAAEAKLHDLRGVDKPKINAVSGGCEATSVIDLAWPAKLRISPPGSKQTGERFDGICDLAASPPRHCRRGFGSGPSFAHAEHVGESSAGAGQTIDRP
jgi:NTP-dependent ternary system trypsin peptidase co-occuring protein